MREKALQIQAHELAVRKEELDLIEREVALLDRLAGTNIGPDAQREIVRRQMLVITNQAEKNAMIDATTSDDDEDEN